MVEKTYSTMLTARVEGQKGPIFPEQMENAKSYAQDFMKWLE